MLTVSDCWNAICHNSCGVALLEVSHLVECRWEDKVPHLCDRSDLLKLAKDLGDIDGLPGVLGEDIIDAQRNRCLASHPGAYLTLHSNAATPVYLPCNGIDVVDPGD